MQRMSERERDQRNETSADRPSSFREILHRDRRLLSRRQMDRRIRNRAQERERAAGKDDDYVTYFPALRRIFSGDPLSEFLAVIAVIILLIAAFLFGRWVGQQDADEAPAQSAPPIVSVV